MPRFSDLPELLAEIAEAAGLSAALAIAQLRGGGRVHFPAKAADDHWLPVLVGREAADKLCEHFRVNHKGGVTLLVPLGPTRIYDIARMRALAMREEGVSVRNTALALGVTTRSIEIWQAARDGVQRKRASAEAQQRRDGGRVVVDLPDLLVVVAEVAGMPVALALSQARARLTVTFPHDAPDDHWLVQAFGREIADRLAVHFGHAHGPEVAFTVPKAEPFLYAVVQRRALVMRDEGYSAEETARALCVTPVQIEKAHDGFRGDG